MVLSKGLLRALVHSCTTPLANSSPAKSIKGERFVRSEEKPEYPDWESNGLPFA